MNHNSLSLELFTLTRDGARWTQWMTLIIGVQVFVSLSIATLLIKDTLMAIVIAACGVFAFHLELTFLNESYQRRIETWILLADLASIVVGWIGLVATYRWRWGTGQYTQVTSNRSIGFRSATSTRALHRALSRPMAQPSELTNAVSTRLAQFAGITTDRILECNVHHRHIRRYGMGTRYYSGIPCIMHFGSQRVLRRADTQSLSFFCR